MIDLPPLDEVEVVRLSREGGLAYIPNLSRVRIFELNRCSTTLRGQVCQAITQASQIVQTPQPATGGDQRFFRVELDVRTQPHATMYSFEVPEAEAPLMLVTLWQAPPDEELNGAEER
ncbi:protealysin inhibitor emfourin [Herbaspirillum sp.]|uniref:protealysin inhibitor emfourin n=1 Tax=Herbaspirillum sp. TaxID=1890675 RepID=UPI0031DBC819